MDSGSKHRAAGFRLMSRGDVIVTGLAFIPWFSNALTVTPL